VELNTIILGDCLEELKKLQENSVDLIFADPPYNMQLKNNLYRPNNTKVAGVDDSWDKFASFADYDAFCLAWLRECRRLVKDTGSIWVIGSYHNIFRIGALMLNLGFWILNEVTWHKRNPMPNFHGKRFTNATETLLWCSKGEAYKKYTFNYKLMKRYNGGKQMTSVWQIGLCVGAERLKGQDGKKAHATQKPEELLKRVIVATTKQNDIILDPFFGTGTTGAVAKKLKRNFIGIEKESSYRALAQKRIESIEDFFAEADWVEDAKEKQIRVPFARLIKEGIIKAGELLYARQSGAKALVLADGTVQYKSARGSIHKIGALIQETPSCNGWQFWYIVRDHESILIDRLRHTYLSGHSAP
jgi:modification methylase